MYCGKSSNEYLIVLQWAMMNRFDPFYMQLASVILSDFDILILLIIVWLSEPW